jgi:hypothetical protein
MNGHMTTTHIFLHKSGGTSRAPYSQLIAACYIANMDNQQIIGLPRC